MVDASVPEQPDSTVKPLLGGSQHRIARKGEVLTASRRFEDLVSERTAPGSQVANQVGGASTEHLL